MKVLEDEIREIAKLLESGQPLPDKWRYRLFPETPHSSQTGKEYRLVYDGKMKREALPAQTAAAPWQPVREFCAERPYPDGRRNLLVWADNLLALRDQHRTRRPQAASRCAHRHASWVRHRAQG